MKPDKFNQRFTSELQTHQNLVKKHLRQLYNIDTKLGKLYIVSQISQHTIDSFKEAKEYKKLRKKIEKAEKKSFRHYGFERMKVKLEIGNGVAVLFWKTLTEHEKDLYTL